MKLETVKIVAEATHENPHGFVIINKSDFDAEKHVEFDDRPKPSREQLDATLDALPGDQTDPDYVVNAMRAHFGALFTADDEARVRSLVKPPAPPKGKGGDKPKAE